jgi:hypothetical protein
MVDFCHKQREANVEAHRLAKSSTSREAGRYICLVIRTPRGFEHSCKLSKFDLIKLLRSALKKTWYKLNIP